LKNIESNLTGILVGSNHHISLLKENKMFIIPFLAVSAALIITIAFKLGNQKV
jgi:hypothetical protein